MSISILFLKKNATFRDYDCDLWVVSWILFIKSRRKWVNSYGELGLHGEMGHLATFWFGCLMRYRCDVRRTVGLEGGVRTWLLKVMFVDSKGWCFGRGVLPEEDRLGLALSVDWCWTSRRRGFYSWWPPSWTTSSSSLTVSSRLLFLVSLPDE